MNEVDKRNKFDEEIFSFKTTKDGKVFIYWFEKQVTILKGRQANKFLSKINRADEKQRQLIMAKETGNFKRGNEKK